MKNEIKVSVIIPVYNTGKYLGKCLDSLVNQTLKEIEIIVVDDGSKEDIKSTIGKYGNKITYIKNKHKGIGYTRNTGIKKAKGEYIGFVDSDDYVDINMYKDYYEYALSNDLDLVVGNVIRHKEDKEAIISIPYFEISNIKKNPKILINIDYGPCNKIYRRDLILKHKILFDEKLKYEDLPFVANALNKSKKIGHINKAYYFYTIREASQTTTFSENNFDIIKILDYYSKIFKKEYFLEAEYVIVNKLLDYNIQQRNNKDKNMKTKFINKSFDYINDYFPNFKNNIYLKEEPFKKRFIKNNKTITMLYCYLYSKFNRNMIK